MLKWLFIINNVKPADRSMMEIIKKIFFVLVEICRTNKPVPVKIRMIGTLIPSLLFNSKFSEIKKYTPRRKIMEPRKTDNLFCLIHSP
jgi:hypothetical protein